MKKIFWLLLLLGAYTWSVSTGRDQFVWDQGTRIYQFAVNWLDDAEVDFQVKKAEEPNKASSPKVKEKKRPRRWD